MLALIVAVVFFAVVGVDVEAVVLLGVHRKWLVINNIHRAVIFLPNKTRGKEEGLISE